MCWKELEGGETEGEEEGVFMGKVCVCVCSRDSGTLTCY